MKGIPITMSLLLNSGIDNLVNTQLTGRLLRVGGKVEQLYNYRNCTVEDVNIVNLRSRKFGQSFIGKMRYGIDLLEQEIRFLKKGYHAVRDKRTHYFDIHEAQTQPQLKGAFDGILSSNVIEHSYNTIHFLLQMHSLVKESGYHYHAIPCYRFTFDKFRTPTTIKHFISDFTNKATSENLDDHALDHYESACKTDPGKDIKKPAFPHIHCHVFDEHNTKALFEMIFEDVTVDIVKTAEFSDVVVLCRNTLNRQFRKQFSGILEKS